MAVPIFFASNRNVLDESSPTGALFGDRFNIDGPQCFRVGRAEATLTGTDPKQDDNWSVGKSELYPEKLDDSAPGGVVVGSSQLFTVLRDLLKDKDRDVIVYLHGFANTFENSVARAAALQQIYSTARQKVLVVLFSWPSNGEVRPSWNYFSDREDAEASALAMGRALKKLVDFLEKLRKEDEAKILEARAAGQVPDPAELQQCTRRLHILAHSMGNWALRHAVRKFIELNEGRVPRVFDCAFLMAADEDADALALPLKLKPLDELASRVFVYHASNDVALAISDTTKGMPYRLGTDGPKNLDVVSERVMAINCTKVSETVLSHGRHQYYRLRDEVIRDVQATLAGVPQIGRRWREPIREGRSWLLPAVKA